MRIISIASLLTSVLIGIACLRPAAWAEYDNYGGYGGESYGGSYGGGSYGGGYGGGGSYGGFGASGGTPIISLELDEHKSRNSSLRTAARENRIPGIERALSLGADVNSQAPSGETALIYASRNCSAKVVSYLLSLKSRDGRRLVNPNLKDSKGRTALMYAADATCKDVVHLLLDTHEVDVAALDHYGISAKEYALHGTNLEMGGPASESFVMIRNAERRARQRAGQLAKAQTSKSAKKKRATYEE